MYNFLLNLDSNILISFLGLIIQMGTLVVAGLALSQLRLMKEQNGYVSAVNKIDALKRFTEIIKIKDDINVNFKSKYGFDLPKIELNNYTLAELVNKNDLDNFKKIVEILEKDTELNQALTSLANNLELFSVSLEDKNILNSIRDMVAKTFCVLVEGNSVPYIVNREDAREGVHNLYEKTISLRKVFIPYVGSIQERKDMEDKKVRIYRELFAKL